MSEDFKCPKCNSELIWGGDFSFEDYGREDDGVISNYSCQECHTYVEVYYPEGEEDE